MERKKFVILIADDNQDFLDILIAKLTREKFDVHTVTDGREAIEMAKELRPDLLILDLEMPVMGGMEAFFELRKDSRFSKLKVVFITTHGDDSEKTAWVDDKFAREEGIRDFFARPTTLIQS